MDEEMGRASWEARIALNNMADMVGIINRLCTTSLALADTTEQIGDPYWKDQVIGQLRGCVGMIELALEDAEKILADGKSAANFLCGREE